MTVKSSARRNRIHRKKGGEDVMDMEPVNEPVELTQNAVDVSEPNMDNLNVVETSPMENMEGEPSLVETTEDETLSATGGKRMKKRAKRTEKRRKTKKGGKGKKRTNKNRRR